MDCKLTDANVAALQAYDAAHLWHPYTSMTQPAPVYPVSSAAGVRLQLTDGRALVDGMSSWWAAIHGYNHPVLNKALTDQIGRMSHVMFGGLTHQPAVDLARLLVEITPEGLDKVFLCDSGSVAVEVAMKMALQYWQANGQPRRGRFLTVRSGYHGDTFHAMSVCDPVTGMHSLFEGTLPKQFFAEVPSCRFGERWDPAALQSFERELVAHGDQIAAVILEPIVQGAGGMRFYAPEYLSGVRALCDEHGVLLILDEIATGFGRTGCLFGCNHANVTPDIMCLGKALTGGYMSLAATVTTAAVAEGLCRDGGVFMHGPTFMGNPLACAVACASISLLMESPWQTRVARIETRLRAGLGPCRAMAGVRDVRVLGAVGVVELDRLVDVPALQRVVMAHGVWLRPFSNLLYTMPPFVIEEDDLDMITAAMRAAVASMAEEGTA